MMWAGISLLTKTPILLIKGNLNADRYCNLVFQPVLVPYFHNNCRMTLAQDNAPCHVARATRAMLAAHNIRFMPWPAKSPDLNPIEHVWDLVKRRVRARTEQINIAGLTWDIQQIWNDLPQQYLHRYIASMRSRCRAVIDGHGGHTRY